MTAFKPPKTAPAINLTAVGAQIASSKSILAEPLKGINMICNSALLVSYVLEAKQITLKLHREAMEEFKGETKIDSALAPSVPAREWVSEEIIEISAV